MTLLRTRTAFGGYDILEGEPRSAMVRNATVIGWALYDDRRLLVTDSAFAREGLDSGRAGLTTIGSDSTTNRNIRSGPRLPDGEQYVWIGHMHRHFGHFLISTLSRMWSIARYSPGARLVTPGAGTLAETLALPFVSAILKALDLSPDRFVEVGDGITIPEIAVPEALLTENSAAHRAFSRFGLEVARLVAGPIDMPDQDERPLFLSKHRLRNGVRAIEHEELFAARLETAGVVVASPEMLSLADQIRLWRRHPVIVSFEGSAGHNAIFVKRKSLLCLSSNPFAPSNQVLIDAVADHRALYLNCNGGLVPIETRPGFHSMLRLEQPDATADSVLRAIEHLRRTGETMRMRSTRDTLSPTLFLDEPFGTNLSRGKAADVSSIDPTWSRTGATTRDEAAGAVSGRLTATYQVHTGPDQTPWWSVDLGDRCLVTEIRVFNRNDVARERLRHLVLSASLDGTEWTVLARREQTDDFGGGAFPAPWRWWSNTPFAARFVRISLDAREFLHLDQVEVFGLHLAPDWPVEF